MNTLSNERLEEIAELARKATYKPCAMHMTDLIAACDSEVVEALARELLALRKEREAAVPVHQFIYNNPHEEGYTEWLDCNEDYFNGVPDDCRRILYTTQPAQPVAVPELKELEAVLDWILMLPVPTQKATQMAKRLAVVIDSCRAAMLNQAPVNQPASNEDQP